MELVSIIVPVYNVEFYLSECIQSLINQTYTNIEIILVDDGSKDKSGQICDEFTKRDSRIKVIHKQNEGLGLARNSGLAKASGKYVTFIDSDDIADADLVKMLICGIEKNGADTCIGGFKRIAENGTVVFEEKYDDALFDEKAVYNNLFARMLGSAPNKHDAIRMSVWNVLYNMEYVIKYNLRFPSERKFISEDIIWDAEYYKYAKKVQIINSTAYSYRITPGSLTQKYKPNMFKMINVLYKDLESKVGADIEKRNRLQRQYFVNIRSCIQQENKKNSNNPFVIRLKNIKLIINDELVSYILDDYPINKIQLKQKIFLMLIKYRMSFVLLFLADIKKL